MKTCNCREHEHWNPASILHPVDLWVIIQVQGAPLLAKRSRLLESRADDRVYQDKNGTEYRGMFLWMYP